MGDQWWLRTQDEVFGPVSRANLLEWAQMGRIQPGQEVSTDGETWRPAPEVDFLDMRWSIDIGDGTPRGPFNKQAAQALLASGRLPKGSRLVETVPAFDAADEAAEAVPAATVQSATEAAVQAATLEELRSQLETLRAGLKAAEQRADDAERKAATARGEAKTALKAADVAEARLAALQTEAAKQDAARDVAAADREKELEVKLLSKDAELADALKHKDAELQEALAARDAAHAADLRQKEEELAARCAANESACREELQRKDAETAALLAAREADKAAALKAKDEERDAALAAKKAECDELLRAKDLDCAAVIQTKETDCAHRLAEKDATIAARDRTLAERNADLAALDAALQEKSAALAACEAALAARDQSLAAKEAELAEQRAATDAATAKAETAVSDLARFTTAKEQSDAAYEDRIKSLEDDLKRLPPTAQLAADAQAAVYAIMKEEADELAATIEAENREAEALREYRRSRAERLLARRQEILRRIGTDAEDMSRRALKAHPEDPRTTHMRQELEALRLLQEKSALEAERKIRDLAAKLRERDSEVKRLTEQTADVTVIYRQMQDAREKLRLREKELVDERQRAETERQQHAAAQQALVARLSSLELSVPGGSNQSKEARKVRLAPWMALKK